MNYRKLLDEKKQKPFLTFNNKNKSSKIRKSVNINISNESLFKKAKYLLNHNIDKKPDITTTSYFKELIKEIKKRKLGAKFDGET